MNEQEDAFRREAEMKYISCVMREAADNYGHEFRDFVAAALIAEVRKLKERVAQLEDQQ